MVNNIMPSSSDEDMTKDSPDAIISDIVDKIETSQNIELYSALGKTGIFSKTKKDDVTIDKPTKPPVTKAVDKNGKIKSEKEVSKELSDNDKEKLVKQIKKAAESSTSTEEAIDKLDKDDYVAQLIQDISEEESNDIKVSATRRCRVGQTIPALIPWTLSVLFPGDWHQFIFPQSITLTEKDLPGVF